MRFSPRRPLGRTGFVATRIGAGDLADRAVPFDDCVATLRRALDAGVNVVDTAPAYEDGYSEEIVGAALRGRPRDAVFVIDKVDHLDQPVAPQVAGSLARLGLTHADAFVFHGVSRLDAWASLAAPGGGMDALDAEKAAGRARFVGISSHHPEVLRAALDRCDLVMFPVGPYADPRYVDEILPLARARGVGTVGFKVFGAGKLLGDTEGYQRPLSQRPRGKLSSGGAPGDAVLPRMSVEACLRYALTVDPDVALLGLSFPNEQDEAFAAVAAFAPLDADGLAAARREAAVAIAGKGRVWWDPA